MGRSTATSSSRTDPESERSGPGPSFSYPIFLDLSGRKCVVVGGGPVGERKTRKLLEAGARVSLVSPEATQGLARLGEEGGIDRIQRRYQWGDLEGAFLAFAATNRPEVNRAVAAEARTRGILLNSAEAPDTGDFILPSFFEKGMLRLALSTGGRSPARARSIREMLEILFSPECEEAVDSFLEWLSSGATGRLRKESLEEVRKTLIENLRVRG